MKEINVVIGGPQGSGIETSMSILSKISAGKGYWILAEREYYSNIVGRHSYIIARISSERQPRSLTLPVQILAAVDAETIFTHYNDIENGVVIYNKIDEKVRLDKIPSMEDLLKLRIMNELKGLGIDPSVSGLMEFMKRERGVEPLPIDFAQILGKLSESYRLDPRQLSRYVSTIVVSAITTLLGLDEGSMKIALSSHFRDREEIVEQNFAVFREVSKLLSEKRGILKLEEPKNTSKKMLVLTGNEAVAIGKIIGGLRYQSYYPITPAADESEILEKFGLQEVQGKIFGPILVMQTEDEISAIASAIGASLSGARSSTATSGPGFDLMVEAISWAGMNEVPVVITFYQRGGPSTGLPTRGGQSDLMAAIFSGHGEFARVVLASGDHEEAMYDAADAFNIAERFQVPVIHLLDKFLANTTASIPIPKLDEFKVDRGIRYKGTGDYKRFDLSSQISPRAFIGERGAFIWYTGDEHDERGHISEETENRIRMYNKRMEKIKLIEEEVPSWRKLNLTGSTSPDFIIIGWGSVKGVALEALEKIEARTGFKGTYANLRMLWPFPRKELKEITSKLAPEKIIVAEHSYGANIASLMAMDIKVDEVASIVKYTGRPMMLKEFVEALELILSGKTSRVVLKDGA
ncbi:MAG: 2-oxoacid:ferredoxin oxidoreductase subunit alpha [Fervidicoccaceae archaeon]